MDRRFRSSARRNEKRVSGRRDSVEDKGRIKKEGRRNQGDAVNRDDKIFMQVSRC